MKNIAEFERVVARLVIFRAVFQIMSWLAGVVILVSLLNTYSDRLLLIGILYLVAYAIVDKKIKARTVHYLERCHKIYQTYNTGN